MHYFADILLNYTILRLVNCRS